MYWFRAFDVDFAWIDMAVVAVAAAWCIAFMIQRLRIRDLEWVFGAVAGAFLVWTLGCMWEELEDVRLVLWALPAAILLCLWSLKIRWQLPVLILGWGFAVICVLWYTGPMVVIKAEGLDRPDMQSSA